MRCVILSFFFLPPPPALQAAESKKGAQSCDGIQSACKKTLVCRILAQARVGEPPNPQKILLLEYVVLPLCPMCADCCWVAMLMTSRISKGHCSARSRWFLQCSNPAGLATASLKRKAPSSSVRQRRLSEAATDVHSLPLVRALFVRFGSESMTRAAFVDLH